MKKIIGILILALFSTTVFGQRFLNKRSAIEYGEWNEKTNLVHFTTESSGNKFFYILAYEPNFPLSLSSNTKRNVYLYVYKTTPRKGQKYPEQIRWIRACAEPVFEHYYNDADNYREASFYLYNEKTQNTSHSSVRKIGYDVEFTIDIIDMVDGYPTIHQETVRLKCVEDRMSDGYFYKVIK